MTSHLELHTQEQLAASLARLARQPTHGAPPVERFWSDDELRQQVVSCFGHHPEHVYVANGHVYFLAERFYPPELRRHYRRVTDRFMDFRRRIKEDVVNPSMLQ